MDSDIVIEPWTMEDGLLNGSSKEEASPFGTANSDLLTNVWFSSLRMFLMNLQEVVLGTKLCILFPAVILAVIAKLFHFGQVSCTHFAILSGILFFVWLFFKLM